eukprot:gnl/TRDRNA2_/TRDRNA2_29607_c0_seq1.p1 gnl/TRDRNA2_/TRDRNA2_29607_c0~~gnl/TRDRNA2_/TRDRNA2_29607_c0_seq1.p1  ORF type:complete len:328 (+),score=47.13 gnl/TRDRNA2_/TRDRNA2_29607_c0_seq1:49-1032(+)
MLPRIEARVEAILVRQPFERDLAPKDREGASVYVGERPSFSRLRIGTDGSAIKVEKMGLQGSVEYHRSVGSFKAVPRKSADERALLAQTTSHICRLHDLKMQLKKPLGDLPPGAFGENLFLNDDIPGSEGMHACNVCIGDEFRVWRGETELPLRVQVSSPRRPCSKVDQVHGSTFTAMGVRAHCARLGFAGILFRVLTSGDVQEGDVFRLHARPHPTWDLQRVSHLLYGHPKGVMMYIKRGLLREEFMGSEEELRELAALEEFGICEYKEEVFRMLELPGIGRYRSEAPAEAKSDSRLAFAGIALSIATILTVVALTSRYSARVKRS